ncbi:creatininase family protein [Sphaerisporangium sp. NPDC049002]|uniref:creatininase family protein n=1 Tax=Sphaerisporangium sp. NPDC049002 TaxID=3155392 RepID=UPI0033F832D5
MDHLLTTATTTDERDRSASMAILPIGSFEQHGSYLPLTTDTVVASVIARELAGAYRVLLLPPVTISCSHEHTEWPGTVSISAQTLYSIVSDVYDSVTRSGIATLVLVNGHGGNYVLSNVVQEANAKGRSMALFPAKEDWNEARAAAQLSSSMHEDMHAGELETSILLYAYPDLVRDGYESADWTAGDRRHLLTSGMQAYTTSGVVGRPSLGTADKGKAVIESLTRSFSGVVRLFD